MEVRMASTSLSSRRGLGGFAALVGGALMIVSVFLPWFGGGGQSFTGWDSVNPNLADISNAGEAVDTIAEAGNFFDNSYFDPASSFSPFFTGLSILIAGALLVLIGLAMMFSLKGGAFQLPGFGQFILVVLGILIAIVGVTNLASLYATGPGTEFIKPEYGLFLLTAGALIGFFGVVGGAGKGDS
jgi:hypothetical protein